MDTNDFLEALRKAEKNYHEAISAVEQVEFLTEIADLFMDLDAQPTNAAAWPNAWYQRGRARS